MIAKRSSRRRPGFERLEDLALLTAVHVYQSFSGEIEEAGAVGEISYTIDPDFFSPSGRPVLVGFHARAALGSSLDPATVQIERLDGGPVTPEHVAADLPGETHSLAVVELAPGSYRIFASGESGSSGAFVLDVFLVGDVNGDQSVTRVDAARFAESFATTTGASSYHAEADANLDGNVSLNDSALLQRNLDTAIQPARIESTSPADGEHHVNLVRETIVRFDERVDPATVTTDSLYLIAKGQRVPGRVVVSGAERFATFFYDNALPASTEVRIVVDGDRIRGRDGALLDADGDGVAGGVATADFRTLPLTRITGTNIFGYVYDSYHTNPDGTNIPIVGATIRVDAFPEANATTDENGYFILRDMPAPEFFVHIDGTTATSAPPGTNYPSVGKPFHTVPGQEVQLSMGGMPFNIYLPPMAMADVVALDPGVDTPVGFGDAGKAELVQMFPELDPAVFDRLSVTFPAGSAVDDQGNPATQAVVIPVPPDRIPAPLPPFMDPALVISIQAIGATNFDVPAPVTFPNLDGLLPGEQALVMSFDHDAGRWKSIGAGTVTADGLSIVSNPGVGIEAPGWHFPFAGGNNDGGPPSLIPCEQQPDEFAGFMAAEGADPITIGPIEAPPAGSDVKKIRVKTFIDGPIRDFLKPIAVGANTLNLAGTGSLIDLSENRIMTAGSNFKLEFKVRPKTYAEVFADTGGFDEQLRDKLFGARVKVEVREIDDDGDLISRKCTNHFIYRWISVIDAAEAQAKAGVSAAFQRTFADGAGGFVREKKVDLRLPSTPDTTFTGSNAAFDYGGAYDGTEVATWDFDPPSPGNLVDTVTIRAGSNVVGVIQANGLATGPTTINVDAEGYKQELKRIILALQNAMVPGPDGEPGGTNPIAYDDDGDGTNDENDEYGWISWGPDNMPGTVDDVVSDDTMEVVYPFGANVFKSISTPGLDHLPSTADDITRNVVSFTLEEGRRTIAGDDEMPGTADDEAIGWYFIVGPRFKTEFAGYLPSDRQDPGPDATLGTPDDLFTAAQLEGLDAFLTGKANALRNAIQEDYDPINGAYSAYQFVDVGGDVTMMWQDDFADSGSPVYGSAVGDWDDAYMRPIFLDADVPLGAKMWALAQGINPSADNGTVNDGVFGVAINASWTSAGANFAQFVANTVSHEIGHTFGLIDAYTNFELSPDPNGTAGCNASGNCTPHDIMRSGNDADGNLMFLPRNTTLLKTALGLHENADDALEDALQQYRDTFDLPTDEIGVRENGNYISFDENAPPPKPLLPEIAVLHGEDGYFGVALEDDVEFGIAVADGVGGESRIVDFEVLNAGLVPLTVADVTLLDGAAGFSILDAAFVGSPLEPGASALLRVTFDPDAAGSLVDTLRISSDAATSAELEIDLRGRALPPTSTAGVSLVGSNNFVQVTGLGRGISSVVRIENTGGTPLVISEVVPIEGDFVWDILGSGPFSGLGLPIVIPPLGSTTLGFAFDPIISGPMRGIFDLVTNDPERPIVRIGATGTLRSSAQIGDDFVAVTVEGNPPLRLKSNAEGEFNLILPPNLPYEITIFDPVSGLVAVGSGVTAEQGGTTDITEGLAYGNDESVDSDFDGLPDDAEYAIGTSSANPDTDGDGIDDYSEIGQGLDPLDDRGFPTGVIAALPVSGPANEVVVEENTAYVATGAHGLALVDVSRFNDPILLGEIDLLGIAGDVAVDPALGLAVLATSPGLAVVDVSDPMSPALVRQDTRSATQVEIADGRAYVAGGDTITAIDLVTGSVEQTLTLPDPVVITGLAREGNVLFAMDEERRLAAIDIGTGEMVLRDSLLLAEGGGKLFVGGGIAYVAARSSVVGGYITVDVSNIDNLVVISGPDQSQLAPKAQVVANGSGQAVLVGALGSAGALFLMDATDPERTFDFITRIDLPEAAASVALASGIAFVADGDAGLVVVNYLSFDSAGLPPDVTISANVTDVDASTPGTQVYSGTTVNVRANIFDDVQVRRAQFMVGGAVAASDVSFPFEFFATAGASDAGPLTIAVQAVDTGGNVAVSNVIELDLIPDLDPPTITLLAPAADEIFNAEEGRQTVRLRFSEPLDQELLTVERFQLTRGGQPLVPTSMIVRELGRFVQLTYAPFAPGAYTLTIDAFNVRDLGGNPLAASNLTRGFTVLADTNPPTLSSVAPTDGATTVAGLTQVTLRFSEPMTASTVNSSTAMLAGPGGIIPLQSITRLDNDQTLRLAYPPLPQGDYQLSLDAAAITDRAGNPLGGGTVVVTSFSLSESPLFPDPVFSAGWSDAIMADVNEDGWDDLISSFSQNNVLMIDLFGPGGEIVGHTTVTVAPVPSESGLPRLSALAAADLDGDSHVDLVVSSIQFFQRFVSVLLGDGAGGFSEVDRLPTAGYPRSVALAQMNADTNVDLVIGIDRACCPLPNDGEVRVYTGVGDGTFDLQSSVTALDQIQNHEVALGDFDEDSDLDVAVNATTQSFSPRTVSLLLNNGNGSLGAPSQVLAGPPVHTRLLAVDVDRDGNLDVLFDSAGTSGTPPALNVRYGNGLGGLSAIQQLSIGSTGNLVYFGDVTGDGVPDIVTEHHVTTDSFPFFTRENGLEVFVGDGGGGYALQAVYVGPQPPSAFVVADVDHDGDTDWIFIASGGSGDIAGIGHIVRGNGDGTYDAWDADLPAEHSPKGVALGDLDGDGALDLVSAGGNRFAAGAVSVRLGDGQGQFGTPTDMSVPIAPEPSDELTPSDVVLGDVDGDGDLDVVAVSQDSGYYNPRGLVSVLLGDGVGNLTTAAEFEHPSNLTGAALGDIDDDGDLDILAAQERGFYGGSNGVVVLVGNGDGSFGDPVEKVFAFEPRSLTLSDLDGDGQLDLVVGQPGTSGSAAYWLPGNGDGTFDEPVALEVLGTSGQATAADLDNDGDRDLLIATGDHDVRVLLNQGSAVFAEPVVIPIFSSDRTPHLTTEDLDGDGHLDILVLDEAGVVSVLFGLGAGDFGPSRSFSVGFAAIDLALGDLDGDGDPDLVTANAEAISTLSVRLNGTTLAAGGSPATFIPVAKAGSPLVARRVDDVHSASGAPRPQLAGRRAIRDREAIVDRPRDGAALRAVRRRRAVARDAVLHDLALAAIDHDDPQ
jgi:hypothetical protein